MARKDMLDDLDEVIEGADLSSRKLTLNLNERPTMKMKNLKLPAVWDKMIKNFTGTPSSGYMVNAIKAQMIKDGLL